MASIGNVRDYRILTNNPLVQTVLEGKGLYTLDFAPEKNFREILVKARDLIYAGHILYTHPLAGSVKPNETPYKSLVVSMEPHGFDMEHAELICNAIAVVDKFKPIGWELPERILRDFQLIDYTLLCGAINIDAEAGLSNTK